MTDLQSHYDSGCLQLPEALQIEIEDDPGVGFEKGEAVVTPGCKQCDKPLGPANKSGYCRKHFTRATIKPDHGARISAGLRAKFASDPEFRDACRGRMRRVQWLPQSIEARKRSVRERRLWEIGHASLTPESRAKAGRACSETRLSWCPPEFRKDYLHLIYIHKGKREARRIIEARVERQRLDRLSPYTPDAALFLSINDRCPVMRRGEGWKYGNAVKSADDILRSALRKGWQPWDVAA
jgi:hypothetical protein